MKRVERFGLSAAIVIATVLLVARVSYNRKDVSNPEDVIAFLDYIKRNKSRTTAVVSKSKDLNQMSLVPFDPNTVSAEALYEMGLPPSAVKSMINYREAGFQYRKPEDVLKCYGVDEFLFKEMGPYIVIKDDQFKRNSLQKKDRSNEIQPFTFDPNEVTTEDLRSMNLPDRFINGFINFRNTGAEFRSIEDFDQLYVLTPEIRAALLPYLLFPKRKSNDLSYQKEIVAQRFKFDPNVISHDSLILLGVPESAARTWINFRRKGKEYRKLDDLRDIYGLTEPKLEELSDLIVFPKRAQAYTPATTRAPQASLSIDPNAAGIEDLVEIKGVGRFYAKQIIRYRSKLGGFYNLDQLKDTDKLPDSVYQAIKYHFSAPSRDSIRQVSVNSVSRQSFGQHPYLDYDTVHRIVTHREFVGRIESMAYLIKVGLLSEQEASKLEPYLSFE